MEKLRPAEELIKGETNVSLLNPNKKGKAGYRRWNHVEVYALWKTGKWVSIREMAIRNGMNIKQAYNIIHGMEKKLMPQEPVDKRAVEIAAQTIAGKLVEAQERQADLGKKMQVRALANVDKVEVVDAGQLSSLAKTGVDIERKALGLKDEEKSEKIVINMAVGIKLGGEVVGGAPVEVKVVRDESAGN